MNANILETQEELDEAAKAGAFIATLQAGYTDFHYLRDVWKRTTEKDALIGVSMTGIASGNVMSLDMAQTAKAVKATNAEIAEIIGIKKAARTTCVKPAGTTSLVLGTSSGIHAWHNDYYVRRMRVGKNEAIYTYLSIRHPELIEDEHFRPHDTAVISVPQKAPEGAILRTESPLETLERVKKVSQSWISTGYRTGQNGHNVSCTISLKDDQWRDVGNWMWKNREHYNGIAVLPYDGGNYKQAPFEDCSKETYEAMLESLDKVDLTQVIESQDETDLSGEIACGGGACEVV
jgi:ribonucleoside-diphosphate reductase alpha chain